MARSAWLSFSIGATCLLTGFGSAFDYQGNQTGWAIGLSETSTKVYDNLNSNWRPTSLDATAPGVSTTNWIVPYVRNTGSLYRATAIAQNATAAGIDNLRSNGWRIEDIERMGTSRYSAIFRASSENANPTGWFANRMTSQVTALLGTTRRLVELDSVVIDGVRRFNGVFCSNTGAHRRAWGWMPSATLQQIVEYATQNNLKIIDLDPRSQSYYSAVFLQRSPGERVYIAAGPWNVVAEFQEAVGTRFQVVNRLEGTNWYAAVLVNVVNAQGARIADDMANTAGGGRFGAFVREVGTNGRVLVDLASNRDCYPASSIKVLIHATAIHEVPAHQLGTYKVDNQLLSKWLSDMMLDSDNPSTYRMNQHFGTDTINGFGRSHLGTTTSTWIADHYGDNPPDSNWNASTTLREIANIHAFRTVLGADKITRYRSWMRNETNSSLFWNYLDALRVDLGLTYPEYDAWKNHFRLEFKAGNIELNGSSTLNKHWFNAGRVRIPFKSSNLAVLRTYVFAHFVNDSVQGYERADALRHSPDIMREQFIASLLTYKN
jgi:hypothetical protein